LPRRAQHEKVALTLTLHFNNVPTSDAPPPVLDRARVIAYAVLDHSVQWTGRQRLIVGGKELGPVPRLALCQNVEGDLKDILVFHCNAEWDVLGVSGGKTLEAAKASVEQTYRGVGAKWILTNVTEDEAKAWIDEHCADISCSFCDRAAGDYQQLVGNKFGSVRICNHCIDEYYALLRKA
jgi:ClpX C4-type zinc finger